jgi:hypothetical protein
MCLPAGSSDPNARMGYADRCMLLSFQMLPEQPAPELLNAAALADGLGYYGCYSADEIYHKDAWLLFATVA